MIGIYKITNTINNKCYIWQSVDIKRRWREHKSRDLYESDRPLYKAMRKYGLENFVFEVIEECLFSELDIREQYWVNYYDSFNNGYNLTLWWDSSTHTKMIEKIESIKQDLRENILSTEEILKKHSICKNSLSMINVGTTYFKEWENYPIRKYNLGNSYIKEKTLCIDCWQEISPWAIRCVSCHAKSVQTTERPSRTQLLEEIGTSSFFATGKKYGVSDNSIRKWCKQYSLPTHTKEIKDLYTKEILGIVKEEKEDLLPKKQALKGIVLQCDKDNHEIIINKYPSTHAAWIALWDENKYKHIGEVCRWQRKSAYGYFWRYE